MSGSPKNHGLHYVIQDYFLVKLSPASCGGSRLQPLCYAGLQKRLFRSNDSPSPVRNHLIFHWRYALPVLLTLLYWQLMKDNLNGPPSAMCVVQPRSALRHVAHCSVKRCSLLKLIIKHTFFILFLYLDHELKVLNNIEGFGRRKMAAGCKRTM